MGFFLLDKLTGIAVSFTVAGNTGVTPFLTLLLVGCLERSHPDLLHMDDATAGLLASWPSLVLLACLSALEFVAKCVPVVDEIMDAAMTFVVPVVSTIGSLSTMSLLSTTADDDNDGNRRLSALGGIWVFFKLVLIFIGIALALGMHLTKMLLRLIGEGWLTGILTALETTYVVTTVTLAIFIKPLAILVAAGIILAAGHSLKKKFWDDKSPVISHTDLQDPEHGTGNYVNMPQQPNQAS